jgi:hypothetical protein
MTVEEAQQSQDVVLGLFLANSHPATILFDFGASHSFISSKFIAKHNFPIIIVTPTFCMIKFCQARCALGCILENFSLKKRFSQFNWPKVAFMACHILFSKNP